MIKKYNQFINESVIDKLSIDNWCKEYGIRNYTINSDGSIDVKGGVNISNRNLYSTKLNLKFRKVSEYFICNNCNLSSLEGCPIEVGGGFNCSKNDISSLEGCPKKIGGTFNCSYNLLNNFIGMEDTYIRDSISCKYNNIMNFNGFPSIFDGYIDIYGAPVSDVYSLFKTPKCIDLINDQKIIVDNKIMVEGILDIADYLNIELPDNWKSRLTYYQLIG